ncbi:MAG: type IV pilus modification PilV family protein [Planctomycetaceae bacterium]
MIEVLISVTLISFGVLSLLTLLPSGWRLSGKSDALGRAAGILQAELERNEIWIMNQKNPVVPTGVSPPPRPCYATGKDTLQPGEIPYFVTTEIQQDLGGSGSWRVRVRVTWPGNPTGISESVIVTRQWFFAQ